MTVEPAPARAADLILPSKPTIEGAGVHLRRAFGYQQVPRLDPFLLLDDFRSENPAEYVAGFPWHPHRGIETVTYMLDGKVEHGDSIGNAGIIGPGDIQWMTSGSGIIHQEMPKPHNGRKMGGFQLWVNLPAQQKMRDPRYQEIKAGDIPTVEAARGVDAKVVAGTLRGVQGPVRDLTVEPEYLDIRMKPNAAFRHAVPDGHTAFAYLLEGKGEFDETSGPIDSENLVIYKETGDVVVKSGSDGLRFLLISGKPLREPVAWWGPIVMNNRRELEVAVDEYHSGTFVKKGKNIR